MKEDKDVIIERGLQESNYTFFDREQLVSFAENFYTVTGIPVSLHTFVRDSVELQAIHAGNTLRCSICTYLRRECFPAFRRACFDNNHAALAECSKAGKPHVYRCHMDLCEAIIPLKRFDNERSVIFLGRVDTKPATEEGFRAFIKRAADTEPLILESDAEELRRLYYSMPRMSEDGFARAVALAADYAKLMETESRPVRYIPRTYVDAVKQYVSANIHLPITREMAASHVGVSPGYLSHVFARELGCSFSEYVTAKKLEMAKELLSSTSLPIITVSERCGYDNPKYFSTLFKKHTGMTAGEYRKKATPHLDNPADI